MACIRPQPSPVPAIHTPPRSGRPVPLAPELRSSAKAPNAPGPEGSEPSTTGTAPLPRTLEDDPGRLHRFAPRSALPALPRWRSPPVRPRSSSANGKWVPPTAPGFGHRGEAASPATGHHPDASATQSVAVSPGSNVSPGEPTNHRIIGSRQEIAARTPSRASMIMSRRWPRFHNNSALYCKIL